MQVLACQHVHYEALMRLLLQSLLVLAVKNWELLDSTFLSIVEHLLLDCEIVLLVDCWSASGLIIQYSFSNLLVNCFLAISQVVLDVQKPQLSVCRSLAAKRRVSRVNLLFKLGIASFQVLLAFVKDELI